ncbi:UNVERIFIED_CONTAM: hypothetical protein HDU68_002836 [Siphonaria sp. JEL0065]|nr:hypothetical protein HDU68_002836 [Siphonaria sp. JEL0065]
MIYGTVIPVLERVLIYLSELLEFSKSAGKYADIGLFSEPIEGCIECILEFAQELQSARMSLKQDLADFNEFFLWLTFSIEAISTLDRTDELATPDFNITRVFSALDKLYHMDSHMGSFFGKGVNPSPSHKSAPGISAALKQGIKSIFDNVWGTVEKSFGVRLEIELGEVSDAQMLLNGWKPFVSMTADLDGILVAVTLPDSNHVALHRVSNKHTPTVSRALVSVHENSFLTIPLASWKLSALVFIHSDVVVAFRDEGSEKSCLVHMETGGLEFGENVFGAGGSSQMVTMVYQEMADYH